MLFKSSEERFYPLKNENALSQIDTGKCHLGMFIMRGKQVLFRTELFLLSLCHVGR